MRICIFLHILESLLRARQQSFISLTNIMGISSDESARNDSSIRKGERQESDKEGLSIAEAEKPYLGRLYIKD